jgi:hypothetical protein
MDEYNMFSSVWDTRFMQWVNLESGRGFCIPLVYMVDGRGIGIGVCAITTNEEESNDR